tara:strand:- start:779 stop:2185 length:1407 start_codon:yes stop_codon:yes gene_type:complete
MENKEFLESYFKERAVEFLTPAQNVQKKFIPKVPDVEFFKEKNSLYMHLTDTNTYKHFRTLIKNMPDFCTQDEFVDFILAFEEMRKEQEIEIDDYSFVSLRRLRMFTELSEEFLADKEPVQKKQIKAWHNHQITSANFNGQCALNGHLDRDYVVWARTDNYKKLKKNGLIDKSAPNQPYLFFIFYKKNADYPFSSIIPLDLDKPYDPTNITKSLSHKMNAEIGNAHLVSFWDQAEFFQNIVSGIVPFKKKIDIRTPQLRFKFIRQYFSGLSQSQLANQLQTNFGIKINQKNIEYWEKSTSEFPPFFKNNMLAKSVSIFVEQSYDFFSYELRSSNGDQLLTKEFTKERLENLIVKFTNDMWEPADFFKNLTLFNRPKPINNKLEAYRDAMKRYGVEERLAQKTVKKFEDLTAEDFARWGYMIAQISESEVIGDLQLVYDNEPMRAKIYHLWRDIKMNLIYTDKSIDPPF